MRAATTSGHRARPLGAEYRFAGKDIAYSRSFQLLGMRGDVTATVEPGSATRRGMGGVLTLFFGSLFIASATFLVLDQVGALPGGGGGSFGNAIIGLTIGSGVGTIGGIALLHSGSTDYSFKPGRP